MKRIKIHRGGRPRQNRPERDLGTPELVMKRAVLSQGDPTLSTSPIDALLSRAVISQEAHSAAQYFATVRRLVFGKAHPSCIDLLAVNASRPEENDLPDAEDKYRLACAFVKERSRQCFDAVENLVVYERWPSWMFNKSESHKPERRKFMEGLSALLAWYKGDRRKTA